MVMIVPTHFGRITGEEGRQIRSHFFIPAHLIPVHGEAFLRAAAWSCCESGEIFSRLSVCKESRVWSAETFSATAVTTN